MKKFERRLRRAVRLTPAADRARYGEEWRRDLASAEAAGMDPDQLTRGAQGMALYLRVRQVEHLILGRLGAGPAVVAWLVLLVCASLAVALGSIFLLGGLAAAALVVVLLARAGAPSHWSHMLLIASLIIGAASAAFVWWVLGVRLEAADSMVAEPEIASWGGAALLTLGVSAVGVLVSAFIATVRERNRRRQTN